MIASRIRVFAGLGLSLGLSVGLACVTPAPESPEAAPLDPARPASEPFVEPPPEPGPAACLPNDYVTQPPGIPTYADEPSAGACWPSAKQTLAVVRKAVRQKWFYGYQPERLDIEFGCDRLGPIKSIIVQFGSGHGRTLELIQIEAPATPGDWDVLSLRFGTGSFRGQLGAKAVEDALALTRAAMLVSASEPLPKQASTYAMGSSSGDFHAFVRLVDEAGHARMIAYSGYPSSSDQSDQSGQVDWIAPLIASWSLVEIVDQAALEPAPPDADSQRFFMERFAEAEAASFYGEAGGWWVHERLLAMAGSQASLDLVPALALRLCPGVADDSFGRASGGALTSILELIGSDEPLELDENRHLVPAQAARWATACAADCPNAAP